MLLSRSLRAVNDCDIISSVSFWPLSGLGWMQHMILNNPASENSMDPSSSGLSVAVCCKKPNKALPLFFFLSAAVGAFDSVAAFFFCGASRVPHETLFKLQTE